MVIEAIIPSALIKPFQSLSINTLISSYRNQEAAAADRPSRLPSLLLLLFGTVYLLLLAPSVLADLLSNCSGFESPLQWMIAEETLLPAGNRGEPPHRCSGGDLLLIDLKHRVSVFSTPEDFSSALIWRNQEQHQKCVESFITPAACFQETLQGCASTAGTGKVTYAFDNIWVLLFVLSRMGGWRRLQGTIRNLKPFRDRALRASDDGEKKLRLLLLSANLREAILMNPKKCFY